MQNRRGVLLALAAGLYALGSVGLPLKLALWLGVWYFTGGGQWFYLFRNTIVRDCRFVMLRQDSANSGKTSRTQNRHFCGYHTEGPF